ncbi:hypothetical protein QBC38DRAFT_214015 [Podospora fimiseda]|uniref:Uncharacterized protein n=1 Tax=Podospora fimiseda TaxID=252190 RepID=A0AAN7GXW7_9PEZI|nr:hypothetical protein QBC38DRAFT_214015 [Podospora fimiseda]
MSSYRPKAHYLGTASSSSASSYASSDSDLSTSSKGSSTRHSMDRPVAQVAIIRCLRCARAEESTSTDDPSSLGMVQIGTNIYYCNRCAKIVGYK